MSDSTTPMPDTTWPSWLAKTQAELSPAELEDAETVLAPAITSLLHEPPPIREVQRQLVRSLLPAAVARGEHSTTNPLTARRMAVLLMADPATPGTPLRCPRCDAVYCYDITTLYDPHTAGSDGLPCVGC